MAFFPPQLPPNICGEREFLREKNARRVQSPSKQDSGEAAMRALRDGPHQYPPMLGIPALRQAVAENARRFHSLDVEWEREVLVTSGATEALSDAFFGLLDPGDEVIVIEPAYDSYPVIIRRAGAVPVPVRLAPPKWELPRERIEAAITPRTRAIVINTPMNPIGKIFDGDDLRFLADCLLRHDLVAIADEVYEHLVFDGRRHQTLFALPEVRDRVVRPLSMCLSSIRQVVTTLIPPALSPRSLAATT